MGHSFDFNKIPRKTINVILPDGTMLIVRMPQKRVWEKFKDFQNMDEESTDMGVFFDALDNIIVEILSENKQGKKITREYVAECEELDFEAKMAFLDEYMTFVTSGERDPN